MMQTAMARIFKTKKSVIILLCVVLFGMIVCNRRNNIESKAEEAASSALDRLEIPSLKILGREVLYADRSLCIMQFDVSVMKPLIGLTKARIEAVYMVEEGKTYFGMHMPSQSSSKSEVERIFPKNDESVYLSSENLKKGGVICESLSYEKAMHYRSTLFLNRFGQVVGKKSKGNDVVRIPVPTGTGNWTVGHHLDAFNHETSRTYLFLPGSGTFAGSIQGENNPMSAILYYDSDGFRFKFFELSWNKLVQNNNEIIMMVKDSHGVVHNDLVFMNSDEGIIRPRNSRTNKELESIVDEGGTINIVAVSTDRFGMFTVKYTFEMDISGFRKAKRYLSK